MTNFYNICSGLLYISLYMIASVCLHFSAYAKDKKEKKLFYFLAAGLVIVFAALRNGVGTDYYNYSNEYKQVGKTSVGTYLVRTKQEKSRCDLCSVISESGAGKNNKHTKNYRITGVADWLT